MKIILAFLPLCLLFTGAFLSAPEAFAMVRVSDPVLQVSPATPKQYEQTTVSINNPNVVPTGAIVQWFVNDIEYTSDQNQRSISILTQGVGEETVVEAKITPPTGAVRSLVASIEPVRVDLIVNSNGHTPYFYGGRTVPTGSSQISVAALVFDSTGGPYTYSWWVNGQLQTSSVGGTSNLVVFKPGLDSEMFVEVEVRNQFGNLIAKDNLSIPLFRPEIIFYESSSLRGLLPNALRNPYLFLNEEITLRGEPYYFSAQSLDDYDIRWTVDGSSVQGDTYPLELTLAKTLSEGEASIGLKIINTADFMESANSSLVIEY